MKTQVVLFFMAFAFFSCENNKPNAPVSGQPEVPYNCEVNKAQFLAVDSLVGVMQNIDPWGDDPALDSIADLNVEIEKQLTQLLACAAVETLDLDVSLFENLDYIQTDDGRIRNFNWYANNGGTWQEMRRIYQYYPQPYVAKVTAVDHFTGAKTFYKLKSDPPMYLGIGYDRTCSTCSADYADLFSFQADTMRIENVVSFESRMGDLVQFDFDPKTKTLNYVMLIDDMNEDWARDMPKQKFSDLNIELGDDYEGWQPEAEAEAVVGSFVFSGEGFVEQ